MFFLSEGFTFRNFVTDVFAVFLFVLWFWLLIIVIGDLFRRHDISGWGQGDLGHSADRVPLSSDIRVYDHAVEGHGGAKQPTGATGT